MKRLATRVLGLLFTLISLAAHASDPATKWEQIETEHFLLIFDSKHRPLGELYARYAEQSFTATAPTFKDWPAKTVLLIDDSTDIANGLATGVPYPMIVTYPVLPTSLDSIGDYGNWGLELLTHEYTHILSFEPATGFMRPLRWVFGSIVRPNVLLPRWYLEGLAVEMETRYSRFGRLRSPNYLSIPRAMVEEETLQREDISRINETSIPDWPGGIRPYLMGALLWNELTRLGGSEIISQLTTDYSRRVPFLINGPVESRLGIDYVTALAKVYERVERQARAQLERIRTAGTSKEIELSQPGYFSHSPFVSPDGKSLVFIAKAHNVDSMILHATRPSSDASFSQAKPTRVTDGSLITRASWLPDSSALIYDSIDTYKRHFEYADLYRLDLATKKKTQLTHGLRSREPAVSRDGKHIVFVQNVPGSTQLAAVDINGGNYSVLYTPPIQTRLARPEFLSNDQVIFTEKRDDGSEGFRILALGRERENDGRLIAKGEPRQVLNAFRPVHFPRMTKEGLLFVSDRSGAANLYLANADLTDARAVSNTTTRLMAGELDPITGDLIYSKLTARGPLIHMASKDAWSRTGAPPQIGSIVDYEWPTYAEPKVEVKAEAEPYDPFPHLLPSYWMPYLYFYPGGSYFQASTANSDPTGRHSYAATAAYDTLPQAPSFFAAYTNRTTEIPLTLSGESLSEYIQSLGLRRKTSSGSLGGKFYLPNLNENWRAGFGLTYLSTDLGARVIARGGASASISWTNVSQKGLEISPEKGGAFNLTHAVYHPSLGNTDYEQTDVRGAYYLSKWLPERHALALSVNASIAPRLPTLLLGRSSYGGSYQNSLTQGGIIMRGYESGVFLGRNIVSGTAEYRFPLAYPFRGFGTTPFFVQRLYGDVFVDAITLDGLSVNGRLGQYQQQKLGTFFVGTGAEIKADTTLFYHLPVQFTLGLYYGLDRNTNRDGLLPFIGAGY